MKKTFYLIFFLICTSLVSFAQRAPFTLHWELSKNDVNPSECEAFLTITNTSNQTLSNKAWKLHFALMSLHPIYIEGDALLETEIQASWHSIEPTKYFTPLAPGESHTYTMRYKGSAIREITHPEGFFLIANGESPISIPCTYAPYTRPEQMKRGIVTWEKTPYADGPYVYDYVQHILNSQPSNSNLQTLLPQPKHITYTQGLCYVHKAKIELRTDANMVKEGYAINITRKKITIEASDSAGIFYAQQTLKQWGDTIPCGRVTDYPDLHHRGLMLDIARNYYPVDSI